MSQPALELRLTCSEAFSTGSKVIDVLINTVAVALRMLDSFTDLSRFPLALQAEQALGSRRIRPGVSGLVMKTRLRTQESISILALNRFVCLRMCL